MAKDSIEFQWKSSNLKDWWFAILNRRTTKSTSFRGLN